jgi:hypothetical protein
LTTCRGTLWIVYVTSSGCGRHLAQTAFAAVGKPPRIHSLPVGLLRGAMFATRLVSRQLADLIAFQTAVLTRNMVAPATGTRTLLEHFRGELQAQRF